MEDLSDEDIEKIFDSQYAAAEYLGLKRKSIAGLRKAIKENVLYKGYFWKHLKNTQ